MQSMRARVEGYPAGTVRFDWLFTLFCVWVVFGLYLDGWAHAHGEVDDSFFTPWHGLLYAGVASVELFLLFHQWRNVGKGYAFFRALPKGYLTSMIGAGLFLVGGVFDLFWHTAFGFEVDLETLLSPAHLILASSGFLMVTGAIRSAWVRYQTGARPGWIGMGPTLINAALVLAVLMFFTEFASPFSNTAMVENGGSNVNPTAYSDLYVMNGDGTMQTRLTNTAGASCWAGIWSPDATRILTTQYDSANRAAGSALVLINADGTGETPITTLVGGEYLPTWVQVDDGGRVAFINDNAGRRDLYWLEVAPDGTFGEARQLTDTDSDEYRPAWSPDGTQLLYIDAERIRVMNMNGVSAPDGITPDLGSGLAAAWSPDGTQIVYQAVENDTSDLFVMNADGTNVRHIVTGNDWDGEPTWSPDGTRILFKSWRTGYGELYALDTACLSAPETCESTIVNLTHSVVLDSSYASAAPDGQILYMGSGYGNNSDTYVRQGIMVAGVLIYSTMLMLIALLLIRRWQLPFGALTLLIALPIALMTVFNDNYDVAFIGLAGGLIADVLLRVLRPTPARQIRWYVFAAAAPALLFAVYFLAIALFGAGIAWRVHLWLGAIAFAGIAGVFVAMAYVPPFGRESSSAVPS